MNLSRFAPETAPLRSYERPEREDDQKIATHPHEPLEVAIVRFNVAFGKDFNPRAEYRRISLMNLSTYAQDRGECALALLLMRHAENTTELM